MKRLLMLALFAVLAAPTPAQAADVARVPLGTEIQEVFASPDGGAWVKIVDDDLKGTSAARSPTERSGHSRLGG